MTATPNEKDGSNNLDYFGDPLITYTLKQGIEDGFLAPYQVVSVHLDKDVQGWEPEEGDVDEEGKPVPMRKYTLADFDQDDRATQPHSQSGRSGQQLSSASWTDVQNHHFLHHATPRG